MNTIRKSIAATTLVVLSSLAALSASQADGSNGRSILKPVLAAGELVASSHQSLLNLQVGEKKVVGYVTGDNNGQHKLTLFVADAFDGSNVPNSPIRYETAIDTDSAP